MRRTKEDAEPARSAIPPTKEQVFSERDGSATTLECVFNAAGVTRGTFYWHFKDKSELLPALPERSKPPQVRITSPRRTARPRTMRCCFSWTRVRRYCSMSNSTSAVRGRSAS
ncbi:TetR family transcriptional regulator [Falsirhodobacter sp. 1013]|uniref:TetR family transcriptional regulator n=1 Tax=Falsirhodobacter sp. 1013 TaxID=3417566 RepID=UPI003EBAB7F8